MKSQKKSTKPEKTLSEEDLFFENILTLDVKKPRNAFTLFIKDQDIKVDKDNNIGEATKAAREKWKALNKSKKEQYIKKAEEDKQRHEHNMALVKKYIINIDLLNGSKTPYLLFKENFIYDYQKENDCTYQEASEQAYNLWQNFSTEEKKDWEHQLNKEKEALGQIRQFKSGKRSGYGIFVSDMVTREGKSKDEATAAWHKATDKTKNKYIERAKEENEKNEKLRDLWEIASGIKPKRPRGAFAIFCAELSQNKSIETGNFLQEAHKRFKALDDADKELYEKQHKILQLKYQIKMQEFKKSNPEKLSKGPTGYNLYAQDKKDKVQADGDKLVSGEFFSKIHDMWLKEPESVRDQYNKKAKDLREEQLEQTRFDDKPIKPLTAYNRFIRKFIADNKTKLKGLHQTDLFRKASEAWGNLSSKEKTKLEDEYKNELNTYNQEMIEYTEKLQQNFNSRSKSQSKFRVQIQSKRLKSASKKLSSKSKSKDASQMTQPKIKEDTKKMNSKSKDKKKK